MTARTKQTISHEKRDVIRELESRLSEHMFDPKRTPGFEQITDFSSLNPGDDIIADVPLSNVSLYLNVRCCYDQGNGFVLSQGEKYEFQEGRFESCEGEDHPLSIASFRIGQMYRINYSDVDFPALK